jgi:FkbM family methyltransferase
MNLVLSQSAGLRSAVAENHPYLKSVAHAGYQLPGFKTLTRKSTRFGIQNLPLTRHNKQRLYNFVSADTIPTDPVSCEVRVSNSRKLLLNLDLRDDLSRQWYYWGYEGYESGTVSLFRKLAEEKTCIFDIGANVGYYTLLAALHLTKKNQRVHAFEPNPKVFKALRHNTELNSFGNVHLEQVVVSDEDGEVCFYLPPGEAQSNGSLLPGFIGDQKPVMTKSVRFDTYCAREKIRKVDLLKVDVEGAELKVLQGMGSLLDQWLPDIICEVLEPFDAEVDKFFANLPYRKFIITDKGLKETSNIRAHSQFRDYYLSSDPLLI